MGKLKEKFLEIIRKLNSEGMTIVMISHDENENRTEGNILTIDNTDAHQR